MMSNRRFMLFRPAVLTGVILPVLLSLFCSTDSLSGTSGSETGNGRVLGCIVDSTGRQLADVRVMLLPGAYDPVKKGAAVLFDTTDTSGNYLFDCQPGSYTVLSVHPHDGTRAYSDSVRVAADAIVLPDDTLKAPGSIKITLPEDGELQDGYFYIPGTDIHAAADGTGGSVLLDSVPAEHISAVCYAEKNNDDVRVIRNDLQVVADSSFAVFNPGWRYTRRVYLNTSASGVTITEKVTDCPVHLRLSGGNFSFDQAADAGSDFYCSTSDGKPLPFEIGYWDAEEGVADVWVKVDTIRVDSDSQYILLYWGNPSVKNRSSGATVFDTADGFQGVWHLNENLSSDMTNIPDATANNNDGIWAGTGVAEIVNGVSGRALAFDPVSVSGESYVQLPDDATLDYHGQITVSCWIRLNENSPDSFNITGKYAYCEVNDGSCTITGYSLFCTSRRTVQLRVGFGTDQFVYTENEYRIDDYEWHFIAGMVESGVLRLFVDDTEWFWEYPETPVTSPARGFIGGKAFSDGTLPFAGDIDEVRISSMLRSSDWIRLNYHNQKYNDMLIVWK